MVGVSKMFPPHKQVLKDIYLSFFYGAKIGIIGLNGSGKSTLLKIIAGVEKSYQGEVVFSPGYSVGYLEQEPKLDPEKTVKEIVQEGVQPILDLLAEYEKVNESFGDPDVLEDPDKMEALIARQAELQDHIDASDAWNIDNKLERAMDALRCPPEDQLVKFLSGGERRRVALCRLLLQQPDILLLDEPTNHLDAESIDWLEQHLQQYPGTVIAITHDRYFLDHVAGWILELDRGEGIPWQGNYTSWLEQKTKRMEMEEKQASKRRKTLERELEWVRMAPKARQSKGKARLNSYDKLLNEDQKEREEKLEIFIPNGPRLGNKVIEAHGVAKAFGDKLLFDNLDFVLPPNGIVGVIGPNGAGKTTLFKLIMGQEACDKGTFEVGETVKIAYVDQTHKDIDPAKTVYQVVSGGLETFRMGGRDMNARAYLSRFNFTGADQEKLIGVLSGGERNRLHLAMALKEEGNVLLLDEPTNHLDIHAVEWLESFLSDFKGACLIVSHDRYFLDRITDKTIELENQKIRCFSGNYSVFLQKKAAEQKAIAEKYDNDMKEIARLEGIIAQQRQWNREKNIKTAESKEKVIQRIRDQLVVPDAKLQKIRFDFTPKCVSGEDVLSCDGLSKSFDGKALFRDVSFDIKRQERVFLLGDNGCGKTTLLKILTGEYPRQDGTFRFGSNLLTGYFDQVQAKLDLTKTVIGEVWDTFPQMTETRVRNALAAFLFKGEEVYRPLSVCSGGERARVALLKLMMGGYNFLLLDEPTNHLDAASREELENTLLHYDGTMLIVSHDRYFINKLATRVLELTPNGVQSYTGNYDDYMAHRAVTQQRTAAVKEKPKTNSYKEQKERASRLRKLRTAVTRLEAEIEETEAEIEELQAQLSAGADYQALMDLTAKLDAATARRDDLYARWENASEELAAGEEEV